MRLFYIDKIDPNSKTCIIDGAEARHIYKVLRMKPGDHIILMDADGKRFRSIIQSIIHGKVKVLIKESYSPPEPSPIEIILCISLIRSDPMDYVIQKSSELGVDIIQPFYSERSIVKIPKERLASRLKHWNEVAKNAAKQCGRIAPAKVLSPISLEEVLKNWGSYKEAYERHLLRLVLWEEEKSQSIKMILKKAKKIKKIIGVIGPEGGFCNDEVIQFNRFGFLPVSIGRRILRAETAAVTFVAIVQYELGDLGII